MNTSSPQSRPQQATAFVHQAAKASWVCSAIIFVLVMFGSRTDARLIVERVALLLMVVGLLLGIIALFGIRKHGARGILSPALAGIAANGLLLFIFATNFFAARAKALGNMNTGANFLPVAPVSKHGSARGSYKSESLAFDYDGAYVVKKNNETGQVILQHPDSGVVIGSFAEPVDVVTTLKSQVSAMQQALRNQSNSGFAQTDVEQINGAIRSGSRMGLEYDKPALGRFHADVYILSDRTNYISVVHIYPDNKKTNAGKLFTKVLQSLKDGG
jgi:hypothetical protein